MFPNHKMRAWLFPALLLWCLAAAGGAQGGERPRLVAFAQDTLANDYRLAQVRALVEAFNRQPGVNFVFSDAQGETARQVADVEDFVARGVDVLIVSPRDSRALAPVLAKAYRQGIPVVLLMRRVEGDAYTTWVGPDDGQIGAAAAAFIAAELQGRGTVLVLQGIPGASTSQMRTAAFVEALRRHPGLRLHSIRPANYLRADAVKAVEEVLEEGRPFDAIYAQSDSMASGARLALRKHGIDPGRLVIVGIDYIREARQAIADGEQRASFTYPLSTEATARVVRDILAGRPVPRRVVVPSQLVTRQGSAHQEPVF